MKSYEHKVQYYETDQMGIAHHSNYIRWFESARFDYMEQLGIPYWEMEAQGIISPVMAVSCDYRIMTHYAEEILVTPAIKSYNSVRLVISYEIRSKKTNALHALGESSHCFLNRKRELVTLKKEAPKVDAVFRKELEG